MNIQIWFINQLTIQRGEVRIIKSVTTIRMDNPQRIVFTVIFTRPIPKDLKSCDYTENKTWIVSLILRNCKILKRNRARGIFVTTPKDVIIENNYFSFVSTIILIEGDINHWYKSGATNNALSRNNLFEYFLTLGNTTDRRGQWSKAIITISLSYQPQSCYDKPNHKNINIHNNIIFKVFDALFICALSVDVLSFILNEIIKTYIYEPYTCQKETFMLNRCRNVVIKENKIDMN